MKSTTKLFLASLLALLAMQATMQAGIIYSQSFTGGATGIGGTVVTVDNNGGGHAWGANSILNLDGTTTGVGGISALTFTPQSNQIYTLTATIDKTGGTPGNWFGVGFLPNNSVLFDFFPNSPVALETGTVWETYPASVGYAIDSQDIEIRLNTFGSQWVTSFYQGGVQMGSDFTYTSGNPVIGAVGFLSSNGESATVSAFQLTSVPEPTIWGMLVMGSLCMTILLRRRRSLNS